jgi:hypothetical protein
LQSNDEPDAAAELRHPTRRHPKDLAEPSGEPSRPARGHAPGRLSDLPRAEGRGWASRSLAITGHTTTHGHELPHPPTWTRRHSARPRDSPARRRATPKAHPGCAPQDGAACRHLRRSSDDNPPSGPRSGGRICDIAPCRLACLQVLITETPSSASSSCWH